jgi:hypothetical protein
MIITKRELLKTGLIGAIVAGVIITAYVILPSFMDLSDQPGTYKGSPTYACTEPFKIQTCLNKTNIRGYEFSNNGLMVRDLNFKSFSNSP